MIGFRWAMKYLLDTAPKIRFDLSLPFTHLAPLRSELQQEINEPFDVGAEGAFQKLNLILLSFHNSH